jgi:hypothetical protein
MTARAGRAAETKAAVEEVRLLLWSTILLSTVMYVLLSG